MKKYISMIDFLKDGNGGKLPTAEQSKKRCEEIDKRRKQLRGIKWE